MSEVRVDREAFYKEARGDLSGPLQGIRVMEMTTTFAGPRVGCVLADYGAEVVRVELKSMPDITRFLPPLIPETTPPEGHLHAQVNRGKKSITLNVRTPEGLEVFQELVKGFDIFVENFKKGTLDSYGCGYEEVRAIKEDIIYVSVTGYGQFGPYAERPGYDPAAQAYSGFMTMNAHGPGQPPMRAPTYLADELAGLHGAAGAMAALRHRDQCGEGQRIDVSLLDAMIDSCTGLHTIAAAGVPTPPIGNPIVFAAPTGIFKCKDGHVYAGVLLDAHWKIMAGMIGRPELAEDPRFATFQQRIARRSEVDEILNAWCVDRTRAEVVQACEEAKIAVAAVLSPQETIADPHVQARQALQEVTHVDGKKIQVSSPAPKFSRTPPRKAQAAPVLGADTDEVLEAAGIDAARRAQLREAGIL